jgi:hypothetical protein
MKKTFMLILPVLMASVFTAMAGDLETKLPLRGQFSKTPDAKFDTTLDYFIDEYKLYVGLPMYNDSLYGKSYVSMCTNVVGAVTVTFNYGELFIDSVIDLDGYPCDYDTGAGTMNIYVSFKTPSCFAVNIFYRGGNFTKGFYYYPQEVGQPHTMAYTMSEPQDARYWMPCMDEPWFKTHLGCSFYVSVPDSFTVACNGLLADTVRNGDTLTWHWVEDKEIATYLMSFTVSKYASWTDTAITARGDTVPLYYCVWPEDSSSAATVFDSVSQMMDCFTAKFGPYPFAKYGMAAVYPFYYGGMEHQGMTTINRTWISGNAQRGIAHELAHMWWGDEVTCGYWADIWLNEGFASYAEAIYDEYKSGRKPGSYMDQWFWRALRATGYPIYNPPPESLFAASMVYHKGAWVLQGLRWVMGDSTFFAALNAYGDSFSYGNAVTSDFQRITEQHYGSSLQWYFDQWVYRAGHPIYFTATYYKTHGDSNSAWMKLTHTSNTGELYKMPLALACSTSAGIDSTIVVWDSLASQDFLLTDDQPVTRVMLDPDSWILKEWDDYNPVLVMFLEPIKFDGSLNVPVWNKFWPDTNCAGYNVYRADSVSGPYTRINQDIVTDTIYFDNTTTSGQEYFYAITAVSSIDTCYETHFSNILSHVATNGVEGQPGNGEPLTVDGLWQNSPNPFGRSTVINYQLARSGPVNLRIFNLNGQLVKTIVSSEQPAGRYQVKWDGRDHTGQQVSSGIYIYCLKAGGREFVKQMQFIR